MAIIGAVHLTLVMAILLFIGIGKVERWINNPPLRYGTATAVIYDDGHTWYSEWTIGRYTLRKAHGDGGKRYYVAVEDTKGHVDYWQISKDDYYDVKIGSFVVRSQFNQP